MVTSFFYPSSAINRKDNTEGQPLQNLIPFDCPSSGPFLTVVLSFSAPIFLLLVQILTLCLDCCTEGIFTVCNALQCHLF